MTYPHDIYGPAISRELRALIHMLACRRLDGSTAHHATLQRQLASAAIDRVQLTGVGLYAYFRGSPTAPLVSAKRLIGGLVELRAPALGAGGLLGPTNIAGADSLQALTLAIGHVRATLAAFRDAGGSISHVGEPAFESSDAATVAILRTRRPVRCSSANLGPGRRMHLNGTLASLICALGWAATVGFGRVTSAPPVRQTIPVDTGRVRVQGGSLYYEAAGRGPTIVLLHAGNLDSRTWDPQFLAFARSHHVVRYDARGFGRSSPANVPYAAHDDLLALLDTLHIARASLVGLSGGGRIAIDFALAHPDRVQRLMLAEPGLSGWRFRDVGDTSWGKAWRAAALRQDSVGMAVSWLSSDWMKPAMEHPDLRPRLQQWILAGAGNWLGLVRHGDLERVAMPPALGRTASIHAPTLAIIGTRDLSDIRHIVDTLVATVPDIRRVTFAGAGHMVNLEQPDRFTQVVLDFLRLDK